MRRIAPPDGITQHLLHGAISNGDGIETHVPFIFDDKGGPEIRQCGVAGQGGEFAQKGADLHCKICRHGVLRIRELGHHDTGRQASDSPRSLPDPAAMA